MRFLDLPEDIFIEIFAHIEQEWYTDRNETFQALRLTCKTLSVLAEPAVFASLEVRLEANNLETLASQSSRFGVHVRRLTLDLVVDNSEREWMQLLDVSTRDNQLSMILLNLSNLRELTIHVLCLTTTNNTHDEAGFLVQTASALGTLNRVERLRVIESTGAFKAWSLKRINHLTNLFLQSLLTSSGPVLHSLSVDSMSVMTAETFQALRTQATHLRSLVFRNFIGIECRPLLSEEKPWACRESLERLQFHDCRGAHAGAIACGLSTGLWAKHPLRSFEISKCGDHDDKPSAPYRIAERADQMLEGFSTLSLSNPDTTDNNNTTAITSPTSINVETKRRNAIIENAHYEHEFDWEMQLLGLLPVKHVTMTKTPSSLILYMLDHDFFKGMETLKLIDWKEEAPDKETHKRIEMACAKRGVKLLHGAEEIVACSCPYGS